MSLFNFGRELGGALGVAFCSALFYLRVPQSVTASEHGSQASSVTPDVLAQGFSLVYIGMSALAVVAMVLTAWRLRKDALKGTSLSLCSIENKVINRKLGNRQKVR